jgi:intracellular sulfur oxidation DsrE/DsrF family protein
LKARAVQFQVCANTTRGRQVDLATDLSMVEESDNVPSGVAEAPVCREQDARTSRPDNGSDK